MSRQLSRLQALVLGLVVLAGLGLGLWGLFAAEGRNGLDSSAFAVQAGFDDIAGVEVGTRVRIQGIDAGEVAGVIAPAAAGDKVRLRLRVAGRLRHLVTTGARVEIAHENLLAGKIVRLHPGAGGPVEDGAELATISTTELTDAARDATLKLNHVLTEIDSSLRELRSGEGVLAKKTNDVYAETLQSLQDVRKMVSSVKQNSDAIKALPIVRSYVVDAHKELVRPDFTRYRKWFPEAMLFEPGRAVLTAEGKKALDDVAGWLNENKDSSQEVVVAGFADSKLNPDFALTLTQKQAEAVLEYLKSNHRIHRTGFWYWSNRSVKALGVGTNPPPVPESVRLPEARIELLVFIKSNE